MVRWLLVSLITVGHLIFLISTAGAEGGTLRIQDSRGLVRAVNPINGPAPVRIRLGSDGGICRLRQIDGVTPDLTEPVTERACFFSSVAPGNWEISVKSEGSNLEPKILNVKVEMPLK